MKVRSARSIAAKTLLAVVVGFSFLWIVDVVMPINYSQSNQVSDVESLPNSIKIVSFNVGLLDARILGISMLKPTNHLSERLHYLAAALKSQNADIVAIQELYRDDHAQLIVDSLSESFPYSFRKRTSSLRIDNGLLLLSRFPMRQLKMTKLKQGPWDEAIFSSKAILSAQLAIGPGENLNVINVHPTSGGLSDTQDSANIVSRREKQLAQAIALDESFDEELSIIVGDFNTGPEIAPKNYEYMLQQGYVDAYFEYCRVNKEDAQITWDASNLLNIDSTHSDSISQRIDHVFLSPGLMAATTITNAAVIFKDPAVPIGAERTVTLSDHYGVSTTIQFR